MGRWCRIVSAYALLVVAASAAPVTLEGSWREVAALDGTIGRLGNSIALDSGICAVGAEFDFVDSLAAGAVYVFEAVDGDITEWEFSTRIIPPDDGRRSHNEKFGYTVSVSNDLCAIGSLGNGVPPVVYVYRRVAGVWELEGVLGPSDYPDGGGAFAEVISLSGSICVVGAYGDSDKGRRAGAAYVFERDGSGHWSQTAKLYGSEIEEYDRFGTSVAVDGDICVVAAARNAARNVLRANAYAFRRDANGTWTQEAHLTHSEFYSSQQYHYVPLALSANLCLLVEQEAFPFETDYTGVAHIFRREGTTWEREGMLPLPDDLWGFRSIASVSISGLWCALAATMDDTTRSVLIYHRESAGNWVLTDRLRGSGVESEEASDFGSSMSMDGSLLAVADGFAQWDGSVAAYILKSSLPLSAESPADSSPLPITCAPNPCNHVTNVVYTLPSASRATVRVYTTNGQLVCTPFDGVAHAGENMVRWNGLDRFGRHVHSGVYLVRVVSEFGSGVAKVTQLQ